MGMIVDIFGFGWKTQVCPQFFDVLLYEIDHTLTFDGLHQNMQVVVEPGVLSA